MLPRVTFGIIVLNGEPFTRYNLRSLYPFAHEIIVIEGASPKAASIATPDGHSQDRTLEVLRRFKKEEDPEEKLIVVTAEDHGYPNGFWPGEKDEQSQAYAQRATGDYLWQIDIDEFYNPGTIRQVISLVASNPSITQLNIPQLNFWGSFDYLVDGIFLRQFYQDLGYGVPRVFRWAPGCRYITHRPPTVVDPKGQDLRGGNWVLGRELEQKGIYCFHYGLLFENVVGNKVKYYQQMGWNSLGDFEKWYRDEFLHVRNPFRVHHVTSELSWLKRFNGDHPPQIQSLATDISDGQHSVTVRVSNDLETLLRNPRYRLGVSLLSVFSNKLLLLRRRNPRFERQVESYVEQIFSPDMSRMKEHL